MINSILILLIASLLLVALVQRLGLSPIIGFLLVGVVVGPHGLGVVPDYDVIQQMAEFGIVFLMFTIGLEFSLSRLWADRFMVLGLGGMQVLLAAAVFALLAWALQLPPFTAVVVGAALAMSSTAIVSRLLIEQGELNSLYGRATISILLFQDLATVIFLMIMPVMMSGSPLSQASDIALALAKGAAVFLALLFVGRLLIRPLFRYIARFHSAELFMLAVLTVGLGAAQFAHAMGLSLALGGFMAGLVVGETEFRHQVESDIRPFQDVLLGLFFITVGMLVDLESLGQNWPTVLLVTAGLILIKGLLVGLLTRASGILLATAARTGIALAHSGEFSLVILFLALQMGVLEGAPAQMVLTAVLLSMVAAPLLVRYSYAMVQRLPVKSIQQSDAAASDAVASAAGELSSHVILCGYGRVGKNVAWLLDEEKVEYIAMDLDPSRLKTAGEDERITYGDATRRHILAAAGLERAQAVVITFDDWRAALKTLGHVHMLRPDISALVRATDEKHLDELLAAGATEVIPDTLETSLAIATHVLTLLGVPVARVVERSDRIRADRYRLLRGLFNGRRPENRRERLGIIAIPAHAFAAGQTLGELRLSEHGVHVTAVRRHGIRGANPDANMRIQAQDTLIVHGTPEALARAEQYLLNGHDSA